jgi:site-specific recombinase XerD
MKVRPNAAVKSADKKALFISGQGRRIGTRAVQMRVDKFIAAAGLDPSKYSPHKLRHTAATLMYRAGVDVRTLQQVLGHENLGTTQIYTHVGDEQIKEAEKKNPLAKVKARKKQTSSG